MNQTQRLYPSPAPGGEAAAGDNPAFVNACMSLVSNLAAAYGWRLGGSLLTQSDGWGGLVWRIDFQVEGQSRGSKLINRFICWGTADGEILGTATTCTQNIAPL